MRNRYPKGTGFFIFRKPIKDSKFLRAKLIPAKRFTIPAINSQRRFRFIMNIGRFTIGNLLFAILGPGIRNGYSGEEDVIYSYPLIFLDKNVGRNMQILV